LITGSFSSDAEGCNKTFILAALLTSWFSIIHQMKHPKREWRKGHRPSFKNNKNKDNLAFFFDCLILI
jgi:hypothetical protein